MKKFIKEIIKEKKNDGISIPKTKENEGNGDTESDSTGEHEGASILHKPNPPKNEEDNDIGSYNR